MKIAVGVWLMDSCEVVLFLWLVCSFLMGRAVGSNPLWVTVNLEGSEVSFLPTHFCCSGLVYGLFKAFLCF